MDLKKRWIDLRSDTVTSPTQEMRTAMYEAKVGDDVYGDDPTAIELERLAAKMMGKEASLFVPSGTFGNQLCLLTHTRRGQEVLLPESNHILWHEVGAASVIAGVQLRTMSSETGAVEISELYDKIRGNDIHYPETGLVCMENAHSSGRAVSLENMRDVYKTAKAKNIPVHLDGARIFNAAVALESSAAKIAAYCDSVQFCLSKGLCAPIGSIVAGSHDFVARARKNRKMMGGGLRQVGILAAAGIVALEKMTGRLEVDHQNAKILAKGLNRISNVYICNDQLDINMVFFYIEKPDFPTKKLLNALKNRGILINPPEDGFFRLVTHYWVSRENVEYTCRAMREILE